MARAKYVIFSDLHFEDGKERLMTIGLFKTKSEAVSYALRGGVKTCKIGRVIKLKRRYRGKENV